MRIVRRLHRSVAATVDWLGVNTFGSFVNVVSDALNVNPENRAADRAVRIMGGSRFWWLRTEAAWIVSEQVYPSRVHLEMLFSLLHDKHPRVLSSAAEGIVMHYGYFSRAHLEEGLDIIRAAPTDRWHYPSDDELIKAEMIEELRSALNASPTPDELEILAIIWRTCTSVVPVDQRDTMGLELTGERVYSRIDALIGPLEEIGGFRLEGAPEPADADLLLSLSDLRVFESALEAARGAFGDEEFEIISGVTVADAVDCIARIEQRMTAAEPPLL